MKKTKAIAILSLAALLLSACGKQKLPETPSETQQETVAVTTAPTDPELRPASLGTFKDNVYENTYTGYACKLDENWTVATAEQLQHLPDAIGEILEGTKVGEAAASIPQILDVQAQNASSVTSFNTVYTELDATQQLSFSMLTEEQIVDATLINKDAMAEAYTKMGMTVESIEKINVTFLGQERVGMITKASTNGQSVVMLQLFDYKLGGKYGVALTFTGLDMESVQQTMDLFYAI